MFRNFNTPAGENNAVRGTSVWSWPAAVAGACFLSALAAGLTGGLLVIMAWWNPALQLGTAGTGLLIAMIGLLLVGSHFLDVAERHKRAATALPRSGAEPVDGLGSKTRRDLTKPLAFGLICTALVLSLCGGAARAQPAGVDQPVAIVARSGAGCGALNTHAQGPELDARSDQRQTR